MRIATLPAALLLLAGTAYAAAAEPAGFPLARLFPGAVFDPAIPTQEAVLGALPGARPIRHEELMRYLETLAAASPRVRVVEYARSWEGRPLVYVAVGDEGTIARLDAFREEHLRRMDPRAADATLEGAKAVAWMAYGIHGDEISSTDAAAAVAYRLVAGEDESARALRRDVLVLIDPCENPDGRERFLAQTRAFAHLEGNPDMEDLSHTAIWPQGRGNHFLFDLNRDWFSLVHPESARSGAIASWAPQLVVDSHEMGADDTYLFSPPRPPFNPLLPPGSIEWNERYATDQAKALDARGYSYYSREWNEEFFPGYGSAWGSYLGAVGILYEMSGTDGTLVKQPAGTVRTFAEAVEHHVLSSMANLGTLRASRAEALRFTLASRRDAVRLGREGPVRAFVLLAGRDPGRADSLARTLRVQGIEVRRATAPVRMAGLRDLRSGESVEREIPEGSWLVPVDQPAGRLVRTILDPHVPMEGAFLREEREHLERGKGSRLYDATAWSLPLLHGVEAYWSASAVPGSWTDAPAAERRGAVEGASPEAYGYLFDGSSDASAFALADLLARGIAVRVAEKPFRAAATDWPRGSVLVKREGNPKDLGETIGEVAGRWGVTMRAVATAKSERGPDLGGNEFHPLVAPRVGVFTGPLVAPASYGSIWHLLDAEARMRFTALDLSRFTSIDLRRFNVLVFPPVWGSSEALRATLGAGGIARLRAWIEAGGTAIGVGSGAGFLSDRETGLTKTRPRSQALDRWPPPVWGVQAETAERAGPLRGVGLHVPDPPATKEGKEARPARPIRKRESPYDVAPVLGPGARPFAAGTEQGTPADGEPISIPEWVRPLLPPGSEKPKEEDLRAVDERLRRFAPSGAILSLDLDPDAWLDWGVPDGALAAFVREGDALVAEPPVQVAARFSDLDRLHLGGLLWPEAAARLAHTAYATREALGRGQVVLFLDHPVYRGWTLGTRRLFLNAILYGPGLGTAWSTPW